jgi:aconitate hydratase
MSLDTFKSRKSLKIGKKTYTTFNLKAAEKNGLKGVSALPYSMKVLLENLLRHEDGRTVTAKDIQGFVAWRRHEFAQG